MFASITRPTYPKSALGIETNAITAVALQGARRGQYGIRQAASIELPPGLITPSFLYQNISDNKLFGDNLVAAVEMAGLIGQKRWSVTLPSNTARAAILALDSEPASKQEAEEVLDWKAEQTFGVPAVELRIARQKISPDREGRTRYFATAIKLTVIDEYESHFEALGWKAGMIVPRALGEANWLFDKKEVNDSLLISGNDLGFTALLLRGSEPAVVRSVLCSPGEIDDEIYRLVMFYNDRYGAPKGDGILDRMLVVGASLVPERIRTIAADALGRDLRVLSVDEVGLDLPTGELNFNDVAAPAGLATLGF